MEGVELPRMNKEPRVERTGIGISKRRESRTRQSSLHEITVTSRLKKGGSVVVAGQAESEGALPARSWLGCVALPSVMELR